MKRLTFFLTAFSFLFLFSGCGQSGPLYVPGNPSTMAVPPANDDKNEEPEDEKATDDVPDSN